MCMTTVEIITAFIGFLICATVAALIGVLIAGVLWHLFIKNMNEDIEKVSNDEVDNDQPMS